VRDFSYIRIKGNLLLRIYTLILFFFTLSVCGQTHGSESGTYVFLTSEISYVKTTIKLDSKKHHFTVKTLATTSLRKFEQKLNGQYKVSNDTIVFSFTYSQFVNSPIFNCKDLGDVKQSCFCQDTLIIKKDSIISFDRKYFAIRK